MTSGQVVCLHAVLNAGYIVRNPAVIPDVFFRFENSVGGTRVPVARLADGTRVKDGARSHGDLVAGFGNDQIRGASSRVELVDDR